LTSPDFDQAVQKYHLALNEFYRGNPEPAKQLTSHREDVSLAGAFGSIECGWEQVAKTMETVAPRFKEGQQTSFENLVKYATNDLGYILEIERFEAKVGGRKDKIRIALRVTSIFRREDQVWKLVHRQGDPLVSEIDPATYISLVKGRR
jgi:ketosteroid isomerase-like protein